MFFGKFCIRILGSVVSMLMRAIPRRYRFGVAVRMVRTIPESLRHTLSPQFERRPGISSVREVILGTMFEVMDDRRIRFDPLISLSGFEVIHETLREHRGILLIGTHSNGGLMRAILRPLYEAGVPATPIAIADLYPICGAGVAIPAIRPVPTFMIRVLTLLRDGQLVCGMLDAFQQSPQRTLELRVRGGSIWISDSLIRLALACKATIVFAAARLEDDSSLAITLQAASEVQSPEDCRRQFISFFERHMTNTPRGAAARYTNVSVASIQQSGHQKSN